MKRLFESMNAAAIETGTPGAVMLYAETAQAMEAYLREVAELTTFPLFLDSPSSEVRLAGCRMRLMIWVLGDRIVYNSLSAGATKRSWKESRIQGSKPRSFWHLTPRISRPKGKYTF